MGGRQRLAVRPQARRPLLYELPPDAAALAAAEASLFGADVVLKIDPADLPAVAEMLSFAQPDPTIGPAGYRRSWRRGRRHTGGGRGDEPAGAAQPAVCAGREAIVRVCGRHHRGARHEEVSAQGRPPTRANSLSGFAASSPTIVERCASTAARSCSRASPAISASPPAARELRRSRSRRAAHPTKRCLACREPASCRKTRCRAAGRRRHGRRHGVFDLGVGRCRGHRSDRDVTGLLRTSAHPPLFFSHGLTRTTRILFDRKSSSAACTLVPCAVSSRAQLVSSVSSCACARLFTHRSSAPTRSTTGASCSITA